MIINPEKLNISEEERQAFLKVFMQYLLDVLAIKYPELDLRNSVDSTKK